MTTNDASATPYAALSEQVERLGRDLIEFYRRGEEREAEMQVQLNSLHRLAGLGTLVAGVAHDAANLMLPLQMTIEHLEREEMSAEARECVATIKDIVKQFQNSVVNLRWLSANSVHSPAASSPSHSPPTPAAAQRSVNPQATVKPSSAAGPAASPGAVLAPGSLLRLSDWAADISDFHKRILPHRMSLRFDVPSDLPLVPMSTAALSQAVFNLIRNAQQAIASEPAATRPPRGEIVVQGRLTKTPGVVEIVVRDNGPGMTPEVLGRCQEPFFTTRHEGASDEHGPLPGGPPTPGSSSGGSGLGLALVRVLMLGCGARVEFFSPPRAEASGSDAPRGTEVVLTLPPAPSAPQSV